jgi:hypothetical protein
MQFPGHWSMQKHGHKGMVFTNHGVYKIMIDCYIIHEEVGPAKGRKYTLVLEAPLTHFLGP